MYDTLNWVIFTWFLASLGIWKLLGKLEFKRTWAAAIPGVRYYALGRAMDVPEEGNVCAFLEALYCLVQISYLGYFQKTGAERVGIAYSLVILAVGVSLYVYRIRLFLRLKEVFGLKRRWVLFWLIFEGLTLFVLGFRKKYQPVEEASLDKDWKAGTAPAQISGVSDAMDAKKMTDTGLSVLLHERSVRHFGQKHYLLKDIAMNIPNGSLVLLLGGSGAGKTTFVNAVIGYEKAKAEIHLNGNDVYRNYNRMKYRIGFVPQQNLIRGNDTVLQTISDSAKVRMASNIPSGRRQKRVKAVMDMLGLSPVSGGLVSKQSGGQLRRISIAIELVSNPELFVLDEPDSGLDGVIAREIFEQLRAIADTGKIVIVITHTPDRVIDLFDKIIVLAKDSGRVGRLTFYGSPAEAKEFFGKDTMEDIVMTVNRTEEGGEGRADEFIEKYAMKLIHKEESADEAVSPEESEEPAEVDEGVSPEESEEPAEADEGVSPEESEEPAEADEGLDEAAPSEETEEQAGGQERTEEGGAS